MMERLLKAVTLGLLTGSIGLIMTFLPLGIDLEEDIGLHLLFKLRGTRQPPPEVVIIAIDKASSDHLRLPNDPRKWPRSLHARLIETLVREGVTAIAFDVFFDESKSAEEDTSFAKAIRKAGNVVLSEYLEMERVSLLDRGKGPSGDLTILKVLPPVSALAQSAVALAPFPLSKVPIKVHQYWTFKTGAGDTPTLPVVTFQIFALEVYDEFVRLMERARPSGVSTVPRDREEILRRGNVEKVVQEIREIFDRNPGLGRKMLRESWNQDSSSSSLKKKPLLQSLVRMYQSANREYINFYGSPGTVTTIPYHEVLKRSEKDSQAQGSLSFKGKAVFIGHSERFRLGQKDGFYTTFSQSSGLDLSGVEIAATAFSNILTDQPIHPLGMGSHLLFVFFWGMVVGTVFLLLPAGVAAATTVGLSLLYLLFARGQFNATAAWYPIVLPLFVQFPLAFFTAVLWQYILSNKERQNIRKAFGYYLPNPVVDQLSKNIANIKTSHQVVYGICLSTDAEHYTSLSEALDPTELGNFMNRYYESVFQPIKQREGIVANVVGDSVLAIWVASHSDTPLRKEACLAALDIEKALRQFNQSSGSYRLPTRIGLHSGPLSLRHIGAMDHYEYRPVGDIVNTATRIEGLNKYLGTQILISDEVIRHLDGLLTREIGTFLLAGKSKPLILHGLLCSQEDTPQSKRNACVFFEEALAAFRRQSWDEAIEKFNRSVSCFGQDGPSSFYLKLCREFKMNPPGASWAGIVEMDKK